MKNARFFMGLFLPLLGFLSILFAQGGPYPIADVKGDIAVIQTPQDIYVNIGDRFYIVRSDGQKEYTLAVAEVERFKGVYCRVQITEKILKTEIRKGDYLLAYDPSKYAYLDDIFGTNNNQPQNSSQPQLQPQTDFSPTITTGSSSNPSLTLGIFSGFGISNFNGQEIYGNSDEFSQATYVPIGAQLLVGIGIVQFGGEFNYSVMPFSFDISATNGNDVAKDELNQIQFGGLVRVNFTKGLVKPFVRGGAGLYAGDLSRDFENSQLQDQTFELNNDFGFNFGGGLAFANGFFEFVYHLVDRSSTTTTTNPATGQTTSQTMEIRGDNWAVQGGIQFNFDLSGNR